MADKCHLIIFVKLNLTSYYLLSKLLHKITLKAKIIQIIDKLIQSLPLKSTAGVLSNHDICKQDAN